MTGIFLIIIFFIQVAGPGFLGVWKRALSIEGIGDGGILRNNPDVVIGRRPSVKSDLEIRAVYKYGNIFGYVPALFL